MSKNIKRDLHRADQLMMQGKVREAISLLESLRADHPHHFHVVYMLGIARTIVGDLDGALDALTEATTLQPGHIKTNTALGFVLARRGEFDRALEFFNWSLNLDPTENEAMRGRGGVLAQLGRHDEAIDQWKKMGRKAEQFIDIQFGLAQIYMDREDFDKAEHFYHRVLRFPGDSVLHEAARVALTRIAETMLRSGGDIRMDIVMYCLSALQQFHDMDRKELHVVLLEIALVGQLGLDVNDPSKRYQLKSMAGSFSGLQLVSYLFTGFRVMGEMMDVGIDLTREYEIAYQMWTRGQKENEEHPEG